MSVNKYDLFAIYNDLLQHGTDPLCALEQLTLITGVTKQDLLDLDDSMLAGIFHDHINDSSLFDYNSYDSINTNSSYDSLFDNNYDSNSFDSLNTNSSYNNSFDTNYSSNSFDPFSTNTSSYNNPFDSNYNRPSSNSIYDDISKNYDPFNSDSDISDPFGDDGSSNFDPFNNDFGGF